MALLAVFTTVAGRVTGLAPSIISSAPGAPASQARAGYLKPPVLVSTIPSLLARHQAEVEATSTAAAGAVAAVAAPEPAPQPKPAYFTYTIQPGDSITSIAASYGIDPSYILWNNHEVSSDPNLLIIGKQLLIPSVNGIVYDVVRGDTLSDIASYYRIDTQSIASFAANNLASPDRLSDGMVLLLPGAVPPPPPPAPARAVADTPEPALPVPAGVAPPPPPVAASSGYAWPFRGAITTYFGEASGNGYHRGIDIDGVGAYGAPIGAAAGGTVVLAAWDDWGLGYRVMLQHADGSRTVYGHLSDIWVTPGQVVSQGEAVGALGSTGYSTGAHLHFELWIGGGPVDPLNYLP